MSYCHHGLNVPHVNIRFQGKWTTFCFSKAHSVFLAEIAVARGMLSSDHVRCLVATVAKHKLPDSSEYDGILEFQELTKTVGSYTTR